ncbi:MAG: UPF0182 family protein [Candidatus Latescibacterota bacterium]
MYNALVVVLFGSAAALLVMGVTRRQPGRIAAGVVVAVAAASFFGLLSFWSEMLWFEALGYGRRFWVSAAARVLLAAAAAVVSGLGVFLLTHRAARDCREIRYWPEGLGALTGGAWGQAQWDTVLRFWHGVPTPVHDPLFQRSVGFYLFELPLWEATSSLLLMLATIALVANAAAVVMETRVRGLRENELVLYGGRAVRSRPLYPSAAAFLFVVAWGRYLERYQLMYDAGGVVTGPGWTDVHVRLPAYLLTVAAAVALGLTLTVAPLRQRWVRFVQQRVRAAYSTPLVAVGAAGAAFAAVWVLTLGVLPALFQWLYVEPNEITLERPYIAHNIEFTRRAFGLDQVEVRQFPATATLTSRMVADNRALFDNIRLWDWRALSAVYQQFQEIRLYYDFVDVDIDRYAFGGEYRQVMVSARELNLDNLPEQSQTFVNRHFKYTHGYGIALSDVSDFTPEGLPNLLVKNLPPRAAYPELDVTQPQIYFGELTHAYAVGNSSEAEFDYPQGEANAYIHYPGNGGVPLRNLWRKFVLGWRFDGTRFFMSSYPRPDSRLLFRRQIRERVSALAPFLTLDRDPYVVLVDGRLYWILDAYTTSAHYPYSQRFASRQVAQMGDAAERFDRYSTVLPELDRVNYLRNSVKVVVDAFDGTVGLYVFAPDDPVVQVWSAIYPGMFRRREEMPAGLLEHIRYPQDLLTVQGLVYAKYHMTDPAVFYNQEDLWVRAQENYYGRVQTVEPYYVMWKSDGERELEFVLMMPFTPKERQVLIGWMAGMCDPENYGRLLVHRFPKEERVLGPQQVETKIDQDPYLSAQLSLWDQRGSRVLRGNVLAIPVENALLYVEPIYLSAETAAYPELRLVVVMHNDNLAYAETFDEALAGLFTGRQAPAESVPATRPPASPSPLAALVREASQAFDGYLDAMAQRRFAESSAALQRLQKALEELTQAASTDSAGPRSAQRE